MFFECSCYLVQMVKQKPQLPRFGSIQSRRRQFWTYQLQEEMQHVVLRENNFASHRLKIDVHLMNDDDPRHLR